MKDKIINRLFQYLDNKNIPHTRFEKEIGLSNGYLNTQLKRNADLGEGVIGKIVDYCLDLELTWLITGKGEMLRNSAEITPSEIHSTSNAAISEIIVAEKDFTTIPVVDVSAAAGSGGFVNNDYPELLGEIKFPVSMLKKKHGNYYCGYVRGDSMYPTLLDRDYIIFRTLHPGEWIDIKNGDVYYIIDRFGATYVKRVINKLKQESHIVCRSDNSDQQEFYDFNLMSDEIAHIYHVEWRFSNNLSNIKEGLHQTLIFRVDALEETVKKLTTHINVQL